MKICVICLSCNLEIFQYQEMVARNTWIKHLKEESIDVYILKSSDKNYIDKDIIYCNTPDDIQHTFEKTIEGLKQIDEYDYVVRTNLTTYINAKCLKMYCQYMKDNNIDIANGCLAIKNKIVIYRGNSLIINNKTYHYLIDYNYKNINHLQDDSIFQEIFKTIKGLKIHSAPFRYYCNEGYFIHHPQSIKQVNEQTLEGIIFISYRIILDINKSNDPNRSYDDMRYVELGRCYEIDSYYNKLKYNELSDNLNVIFNMDTKLFIQGSTIVQK